MPTQSQLGAAQEAHAAATAAAAAAFAAAAAAAKGAAGGGDDTALAATEGAASPPSWEPWDGRWAARRARGARARRPRPVASLSSGGG